MQKMNDLGVMPGYKGNKGQAKETVHEI